VPLSQGDSLAAAIAEEAGDDHPLLWNLIGILLRRKQPLMYFFSTAASRDIRARREERASFSAAPISGIP